MRLLRELGVSITITLAVPVLIAVIYAGYSTLRDPWGDVVLCAGVLTLGGILLHYLGVAIKLGMSVFRLKQTAGKATGPKHG